MIRGLAAAVIFFMGAVVCASIPARAWAVDGSRARPAGGLESPADIAAAARAGAKAAWLASLEEEDAPPVPERPPVREDAPPHDSARRGLDGLTEENLRPLFDIPIVLNEHVERVIRFYSEGNGRDHFGRYLSRSYRWVPMMHEILESYDLPRDLVFVAMIESGFFMRAYSHAHAVGPWQFIASTADIYGLRMDAWVDERRDPVKSTHAAAKFLGWLYREFEDWPLAWAGYNGGPTRVRRNMNRTGLDDYWELCEAGRLPRETCGYVPKIMAAAVISKFPARFGFDVEPLPPFEYEAVEVEFATELAAIARLVGACPDELRNLNPELRRQMTPPPRAGRPYSLRLPPGTREVFLARQDELEPSRFVTHESHTVKPGESFWRIARSYSTTVDVIRAANPSIEPRALRPGMELIVPLPEGARPVVSATSRPASPAPAAGTVERADGMVEVNYTVRPGDSLWTIAQRHGVTTDDLVTWNSLRARGNHVHLSVGQRLVVGRVEAEAVSAGEGRVHVLQAGETLWQLSRRYGTTVEDLKEMNGIDDARALMPGQALVVGR